MDKKILENSLIVFTDGSSLGNPGPGGYGVLIAYPKLDELVELGGMKPRTTNNEMELTAVVSALTYAMNNTAQVHIFTDSQYVINGASKWMYGWAKNGWQTAAKEEIKNKALWQTMHSIANERGADNIIWHHVRGHVGVPGNERVDDIARELAEGINVDLYRGTISEYKDKNILEIQIDTEEQNKRANKKAKAFSYLSLVDGQLKFHATWKECEMRVKGKQAKFKKAVSKEHEQEILKEWGLKKD